MAEPAAPTVSDMHALLPYFRTGHEILADDRRELLLDYLRGADVMLDVDSSLDDVLNARSR